MKFGRPIVLTIFLVLFGVSAFADECNTLRYSDNSDGTVQDCRTGLIWLKDANCTDSLGLPGIDKSLGSLTWYDAKKWVTALGSGHCGLTDGSYAGDWRLPTQTELMMMVASAKKQDFTNPALTNAAGTAKWTTNGNAFNNVQSVLYWSSTTYALNANDAWTVSLWNGLGSGYDKTDYVNCYIWPVRGGQSGTFGNLFIE